MGIWISFCCFSASFELNYFHYPLIINDFTVVDVAVAMRNIVVCDLVIAIDRFKMKVLLMLLSFNSIQLAFQLHCIYIVKRLRIIAYFVGY